VLLTQLSKAVTYALVQVGYKRLQECKLHLKLSFLGGGLGVILEGIGDLCSRLVQELITTLVNIVQVDRRGRLERMGGKQTCHLRHLTIMVCLLSLQ